MINSESKKMTIYLVADPLDNSYVISLIEEYKRARNIVYCGSRNFFVSNLIPDILHIHWPEKIYSNYPLSASSEDEKINVIEEKLRWYKKYNSVIIHTIHNIQPHNPAKLDFERKIFNLTIRYSDILIHHCRKSIDILKNEYPEVEKKINLVNHLPDYLYDYAGISKSEARKKLGLSSEKFIILNFGSQQKYKGEDFIASVFNKLQIKDKFLLTAGNYVYESYSNRYLLKLRNNFRQIIKLKNRMYFYKRIPSKDLPYIISSADMLFLAHQKDSLNSGVLSLAATYGKPVVFPDIGCFKEQMKSWVFETYLPDDESSAVNAALNLYNKIKGDGVNLKNSVWLQEHSWEVHVKKIIDSVRKFKVSQPSTLSEIN